MIRGNPSWLRRAEVQTSLPLCETCTDEELQTKYKRWWIYCPQCGRQLQAKVFVIKENFPAGGGHKITIVKGAKDKEQALTLYKEHTHQANLPSWIVAEEVTEQVTEIFRYDNPGYEG